MEKSEKSADYKKLADKLDENLFSDKLFKKAYVFYAFWFILTPILDTLFNCLGMDISMPFQIIIISLFYLLTKMIEVSLNFRKINFKNKGAVYYLLLALLFWFVLSSVVNDAINMYFVMWISFFFAVSVIFSLDKKHYKTLSIIFICQMVLSSFLGLIDLNNMFVPGFSSEDFAMSLQFRNPNWSAIAVLIAEISSLLFLYKSEKIWQKILYFSGLVVMTIGLFVGGSYAPETYLFLCELALIVYFWVKNKKCPWWIFSAFLMTVFVSFAVWFVPAFRAVTTASSNYFYESLAVIDGFLGTHLVEGVSKIFDKLFGWGVFSKVAGSDGWNRDKLTQDAFSIIFENPSTFMFGKGGGITFLLIRVHNAFLAVWCNFGFPAFLLYIAIFMLILARFVRIKKSDEIVFLFLMFLMFLFESFFCNIEPEYYLFFVIFTTIMYKIFCMSELKNSRGKEEKNQEKKE